MFRVGHEVRWRGEKRRLHPDRHNKRDESGMKASAKLRGDRIGKDEKGSKKCDK